MNIYIVDTRIFLAHPEFEGRALPGYDPVQDGTPPDQDCDGHGTHVAGIAASRAYGVAKNATLHSVRALGCDNTGSWSYFVAALDWIIAHHVKPAIINASLGGGANGVANDAIRRAVAAGLTYVGSAGQSERRCVWVHPRDRARGDHRRECGQQRHKSRRPRTTVRASISMRPAKASTRRGRSAQVCGLLWGTSMAAPHVTGTAALYLQRHPQASPADVRRELLRGATPGHGDRRRTAAPITCCSVVTWAISSRHRLRGRRRLQERRWEVS